MHDVPPDVVYVVLRQHVILTYPPLEQFEIFKLQHADCDVTRVSAICTPACAVSERICHL